MDGAGVALARLLDFRIAFISGRKSSATEIRANELNITDVYNGTLNKMKPYNELKLKYNLSDENCAFIGDDIIDISLMEKVAVPIAGARMPIMVSVSEGTSARNVKYRDKSVKRSIELVGGDEGTVRTYNTYIADGACF